jgi:nitrile hydratase subunit beta
MVPISVWKFYSKGRNILQALHRDFTLEDLRSVPKRVLVTARPSSGPSFPSGGASQMTTATPAPTPFAPIVEAEGEAPAFAPGERVRISMRFPVGHYRVPHYIRGRPAVIETIIAPPAVNNEEEGFGRNAGSKRHYYRIAIPLSEIWAGYAGSPKDGLRIEVFETWLERI